MCHQIQKFVYFVSPDPKVHTLCETRSISSYNFCKQIQKFIHFVQPDPKVHSFCATRSKSSYTLCNQIQKFMLFVKPGPKFHTLVKLPCCDFRHSSGHNLHCRIHYLFKSAVLNEKWLLISIMLILCLLGVYFLIERVNLVKHLS